MVQSTVKRKHDKARVVNTFWERKREEGGGGKRPEE